MIRSLLVGRGNALQRGVPVLAWLGLITAASLSAAEPATRHYSVNLPHHVLRFALPEEVAREMPPWKQPDQQFDAVNPSFSRDGFREIATATYEYKGPFWVGTIGSLKVHFMVQRLSLNYHGKGGTIEDLDRYVHWWISKGRNAKGCLFSRSTLNGAPAVRREWNTFGNPGELKPEHIEIFSLPLDEDMFLDVGFNIREWVPGRAKKWKGKAETLRETIKATIVLEPKKG